MLGDLNAQITAHRVCAAPAGGIPRRCANMVDLTALSETLQGHAERAMRAAIATVPDGIYRHELRADGFDADETRINCTLTVNGSDLHVDYAGTSPQIGRGLNSVMNYTYAYSVYPIKCALDPLTPRNAGSWLAR